jgi:heat shock protein HslJ
VLHGDGRAFNASVGCNTMRGGYDLSGSRLSFGPAASTMMACPDDLAAAEAALIGALPSVEGFAIGGRTLRLLGDDGAIVALLEAVYLP